MKNPKSPITLSPAARSLERKLAREYEIVDAAGKIILRTAAEAFDRMRSCRAAIDRDGETVLDRWQQTKAHPLLAAERDARSQFLLALKQLNLDLEPIGKIGRPGGR
jgi:phage terminase small subunit